MQPPPALKEAILERSRLDRRTPRRRPLPLYAWSLGLAAAAIAIAIVLLSPRSSHSTLDTRITPPPARKSIETPHPLKTTMQPVHLRPYKTLRAATHSQRSSLGPFIPLPASMGLPEPAQAMLIRTRIDTGSLRSYGLTPPPPGAPQTILAEFLVGEDGLPRAIRLIP